MKNREEKATYLKNLCEETYLKDIIHRNDIRKSAELSDLFDVVASSVGAPVNILKLTNTFQSVTKKTISDDTVSRYIDCFEEAFVVSKARKYNIKGRKYIGSPFKLYFEDVGVRNARLNFRQIEESHLMENILYNELRYRGFSVDVGEVDINENTGRKDINGKFIYAPKQVEVDFIASQGNRKYYIQSALSMDNYEKQMQEKKSLYYIDDSFQKIVITKNGLNRGIDESGVITIDLFDFLLGGTL
ncbi:MAG: ATP-binding protein [Oscillospiraceae bacterium]|nr:ATP-binding protein [Oscillospiraceae bacterium]